MNETHYALKVKIRKLSRYIEMIRKDFDELNDSEELNQSERELHALRSQLINNA